MCVGLNRPSGWRRPIYREMYCVERAWRVGGGADRCVHRAFGFLSAMQEAPARIDFPQSSAIFVKDPIRRRTQPQPGARLSRRCVGAWPQYRMMVGNRVARRRPAVAAAARSRVGDIWVREEANMASPDRAQLPSGIRGLMGFCLFVPIYALTDLVLGGYGGHLFGYTIPESPTQWAVTIVVGLSYAPLFYVLLRRSALAWKFGWIVFAETFLSSLWMILASTIDLPPHSGPRRRSWIRAHWPSRRIRRVMAPTLTRSWSWNHSLTSIVNTA